MIELAPIITYTHADGNVTLHLPDAALPAPKRTKIGGRKWRGSPALQCNLVPIRAWADAIAAETGQQQDSLYKERLRGRMLGSVATFLGTHTFEPRDVTYTGELSIVENDELGGTRSIVGMAEVAEIEGLFAAATRGLFYEPPTHTRHVTLYTDPDSRGLSVASEEQVARYGQPMSPEDVVELQRRTNVFDEVLRRPAA